MPPDGRCTTAKYRRCFSRKTGASGNECRATAIGQIGTNQRKNIFFPRPRFRIRNRRDRRRTRCMGISSARTSAGFFPDYTEQSGWLQDATSTTSPCRCARVREPVATTGVSLVMRNFAGATSVAMRCPIGKMRGTGAGAARWRPQCSSLSSSSS